MARKDLSVEHMVELAASWLDPARDRPILESDELLTGPLAIIERATKALLILRKQAGLTDMEIIRLTQEMTELDALHDRMARCVFYALDAGENLASDPTEIENHQKARLLLFPDGLNVTRRSYREQAGFARRVDEQLDAPTRQWLSGIILHGQPLDIVADTWFTTARTLGSRFADRETMRGTENPEGVRAIQIYDERNRWIRGVNTLIAMLEETAIPPETRRRLLVNLYHAEAQAAPTPRPTLEEIPVADKHPTESVPQQ